MLFFIVHDVPGRVRLRARYGFSLRMAQVLADRLDAVGGHRRVRVNPSYGGVCVFCMPTTKPSGPRSCCWRWPLRTAFRDGAPCAAKTSLSQPEGRVVGLFLRYIFVRPFMPVLVRWPRRWRPPFPLSSKGLKRCAVGASVWMSLMPPPSAFPCCAVTSNGTPVDSAARFR